MAIEVSLILPDNLRSTFLRGDFVEQGQTYTTLLQNNNLLRDENKHTLTFGFELVDTDTRTPIPLTRIKSLKISNDPQFDASSTFEITNWPVGTYDDNTTYTYTFDPEHFFDPDNISQGSQDDPGVSPGLNPGYFIVKNWPLSANGGLATVYFKVILEANSEEVLYPGSYGIFDQIFWQTERPSTPGIPEVQTSTPGWVGRKYETAFRASEESSTGRFNAGVARYVTDIIEVRRNAISADTYNLYSTKGATLTDVYRSVLPTNPATSYTVTGYNVQYDNTNYATNVARTINTNLNLNTSAVLRGAALYTNTANKITLSANAPDFCVQAHVQMSVNDFSTASRYYIKAYTGTFNGTAGSVNEVVVRINIPAMTDMLSSTSPQNPTAEIYRLNGTLTPSTTYSTILPMHIVPQLFAGGLLELYIGNNDAHGLMHISSYFTTDSQPKESVLLAHTMLADKFGDTASLGGAVIGAVTGGNGTFQCDEIATASGRFLLNLDFGDCYNNDKSQNIWMSSDTNIRTWNTLFANGEWISYYEFTNDLVDTSRNEDIVGPIQNANGYELTLTAPGYLNQKSVSEIQCSIPTMSSRAQISFDVELTDETLLGEYYVAFSPDPVTEQLLTLRPMVTRCDPYQNEVSEPMNKPTILVGFSSVRGVYITQRNHNNTLTTKKIMHFTPNANEVESWSVIISSEPSTGTGDITSVVIIRNDEVVGQTHFNEVLIPKEKGLGFYASLGVRSEKATSAENSDIYGAEYTFTNVKVEGLQSIHSIHDIDPVSIRRFAKYNTGSTILKAALGQCLIDGQTDAGDYDLLLSPARSIVSDDWSDFIIHVDAVTIGTNIEKTFDCPDNQLDLVDTQLGDFNLNIGNLILVKDQNNAIENGIYEVKFNISTSRYYWERWSDMDFGTTIDGSDIHKLYIRMRERWSWIQNCRVATTSEVLDFNAVPITIDDILVKIGDRVLVCSESSNFVAQGVYVVSSINAGGLTCVLTRASDLNTSAALTPNIRVKVELGTTHGNTYWGFKMIAANPPAIPYEIGVVDIHIHKQPFNLVLEPCRYASNINLTLTGLTVGSYTLIDGDRILVKSQTTQSQNGIYIAHSGAWTRATDFNAANDVFPQMSIPIKDGTVNKITRWTIDPTIHDSFLVGTINMRFVKIPNLEGMTWFLDTNQTVTVGVDTLSFSNADFAQNIDVNAMGLNTTFTGELLDLKMKSAIWGHNPAIRLHLHDTTSGRIGPPLTDWVPSNRRLLESFKEHGSMASKNDLVQFDLNQQPFYLDSGRKYWLVVRIPAGAALRTANASVLNFGELVNAGEFHGLNFINNLYYKLFARSFERLDNSVHLSAIHSRVRASSHAKISSSASALSTPVIVDLQAPTSNTIEGRPYVEPTIKPSVRSAILSIEAEDSNSGLLAFRVGKESHYGMVEYTCWQPWSQFLVDDVAQYTTYLYGTWWKNSQGQNNQLILDSDSEDSIVYQTIGSTSDGSRKVWVQVMDGVGNISESYPITLIAQGLALVDTTPPSGNLTFSNNLTGQNISITNDEQALLKLNSDDRVSAVKDIRFRALKAGSARAWSTWRSYDEYVKWRIDNDINDTEDGLKRLEAQFRDYGNNIEPESALWDAIYDSIGKNIIFNNMVTWIPSGNSKEILYLSGIKSENFTNLNLIDSFSKDYPDNTAYFATSTESGSVGRQIRLRESDTITVFVNAAPVTNFSIDGTRGVIVFNEPVNDGDTLTANVHRDYAVIYQWDGDAVLKVLDMSYYEESVILSMCATHLAATNDEDNYILLGGSSGRVWKFNGSSISDPVFIASEGSSLLPISTLIIHQFAHDSEPYIYAATARFPRLFRAELSNADTASAWEAIGNIGFLNGGIGDITCSCSSYNMLFFGTNSGKILRYERQLINTTDNEEQELLHESLLLNESIGEYESNILPVSALLATQDQILAAISDRPEVWNCVIEHKSQPNPLELWSKQIFNRWFITDPVPWQYYSNVELSADGGTELVNNSGRTLTRGDKTVWAESISNPDGENGYRDLILINGGDKGTQTEFIANTGSDWEQLISKNKASDVLQDVIVATIDILPFDPVYSNGTAGVGATLSATIDGALEIDSLLVELNDRILIKNQLNQAHNGVYKITQLGDLNTSYVLTRVVDLDASSDFSANLLVKATAGQVNKNNCWLLYPETSYTPGTTNIVWLKPTWAMEFDMMHFYGGNQGFQVSDGFYVTEISLSPTQLTLSSGGNSKTIAFQPTDFQMLSIGGAKYPESNVKKIWNFVSNDDTQQDRGPYFTGQIVDVNTSLSDWNTYRFIIPDETDIGVVNEEPETNATFTTQTQFVRITPATLSKPRVGISNLSNPIDVNSRTKVYVRLRMTNQVSTPNIEPSVSYVDWSKVKIRLAWSESGLIAENTAWYELDLHNDDGFHLYVFEPSWNNMLRSLAIEIDGLEDNDRPNIDIDYVALVADEQKPNFSDNLTQVRIAVEGRDVQVWLGKSEQPLLNEVNFLTLPTNQMEIRFGKIDSNELPSNWGWGYVQFVVGGNIEDRLLRAPSSKKIHDFALQYRFPSTGGVRCLTNYQGTAWALTDGINEMKISDNPDDRAAKTFEYVPEHETWKMQSPPSPRETTGYGLTHPLSAISYYGTLIVTGERRNIRFSS